jgi:parallel beta-helix repeat protein
MRRNGMNFLVISLLTIILAVSPFIGVAVLGPNHDISRSEKTSITSYTPHSPIVIDDDTDFVSQGWPGYGNKTHPYLIEGLEITSSDVCIQISGTSVWFAIINCNITTDGFYGNFGVWLESLENAAIYNCTINRLFTGIYCEYVQNTVISNNTITRAIYGGIDIRRSEQVSVFNNTGHIDIFYSTECYVNQNRGGVRLGETQNCNITNSDFGYGWRGLIIDGNEVGDYLHNISGNTVQGFPVVYIKSASDEVVNPTDYGQLILVNCTRIRVLNGIAPAVGNVFWIAAAFCNQCIIENNRVEEISIGFLLTNSPNTYFKGNVITNTTQTGMHISSSRNCTFIDNEFNDCYDAIALWESHNSTLTNNTVDTCIAGYRIASDNCTASGNKVWNAVAHGFQIDNDWNTITDNIVSNISRGNETAYSSIGIVSYGSYNHFENNTIEYAQDIGFRLEGANCTLIDNKLVGHGFSLGGETFWHWMHRMSGNTLNGEPVQYIRDQIGGIINAANLNQLIVANCTGIEIRNGDLHEILAVGYCDHVTIENNTVSGAAAGYWLVHLTNSSVIENKAISNTMVGFIIRFFANCSVESNIASLIGDTGFAISECANCSFKSNEAACNTNGFYLANMVNLTLESNVVSHNDGLGIYLFMNTNGSVVGNEIVYNGDVGIVVQSCTNFVLYNNEMGLNGLNALESNIENQWDNGVDTGNAWSDYNGTGYYEIPGDTPSEDRYPALLNFQPTITPLTDTEYEAGLTGNQLNWTAFDVNPDTYIIYRNGTIIDSGEWNGSYIAVDIDGLIFGVYNYTLFVNDTLGVYSVDSVFVIVVDTIAPTIDGPNDMSWTEGETGNDITWTAYDASPATYSLFINGSLYKMGLWNISGEAIVVNLDHLPAGISNVTILVIDMAGNTAVNSVIVTVEPEMFSTTTTTISVTPSTPMDLLIIATASGVAVIVVFIVFIRSKRS